MNIGEKAMTIAHSHAREEVLERAACVVARICIEPCDGLVAAHDVAWLVAAGLVKTVVNGAPRIITKILDDAVKLTDRIG